MELTDKTKIEFEEWYIEYIYNLREDYQKYVHQQILSKFYREIDSMKYGVYEDYFDSVGVYTDVQPILNYDEDGYTDIDHFIANVFNIGQWVEYDIELNMFETRLEARTAAIEKANEIRNEQLNK